MAFDAKIVKWYNMPSKSKKINFFMEKNTKNGVKMEQNGKNPENLDAPPVKLVEDFYSTEDLKRHQFAYNDRLDIDPHHPSSSANSATYYEASNLSYLQEQCWVKAQNSPQIASAIEDYIGRLTGANFRIYSKVPELQEMLDRINEDYRNELHTNLPKYVGRKGVEGELYLLLTVHGADDPGFVEVDFIAPKDLTGGDDNTGKVFHPNKRTMPVYYRKKGTSGSLNPNVKTIHDEIIPSIYAAYDPALAKMIKTANGVTDALLEGSIATEENVGKSHLARFNKNLSGFRRFVIEWNDGLVTARNLSHIVTVLTWLNYWEELKRYEIDHKKSSGMYSRVVTTDPKSFARWIAMSPEERAATGIAQKPTAGGTYVMPPGFDMKIVNPQLPSISGQDTDILDQVSSGMNSTTSSMTGNFSGTTFSGVKESGKSQSDRNSDGIAKFERFLQFTMWKAIFFLSSKVSPFKYTYKQKKVVSFKMKNGESTPVFKTKQIKAEKLIEFSFPHSAVDSFESMVRAFMGSKSGNLIDALGLPASYIYEKLGIPNYDELRRRAAEEEASYPKLIQNEDPEQKSDDSKKKPKK